MLSHSGLVLALVFTANFSIIAQTFDDLIIQLGLDPETAISEDDILLIQRAQRSRSGITGELLIDLMGLTILSDDDISLLKTFSQSRNPENIISEPNISSSLKIILGNMDQTKVLQFEGLDLQQLIVVKNDVRYQWRGQLHLGGLKSGFIAERDPQELRIIDHGGVYIAGENRGVDWIIGDQQFIAGYGLVAWRTVPIRKSFDTGNMLFRRGKGLSPYRSSRESWGLRGIGGTVDTRYGRFITSIGTSTWDGSIDSTGNLKVSQTGLHELSSKSDSWWNINEATLLTAFRHDYQNGHLGIILTATKLNSNNYSINRSSQSIHFSKVWGSFKWITEIAKGYHNTIGALMGIRFRTRQLSYTLAARRYEEGFSGFRSSPFSEWSGASMNEEGVFQNVNISLKDHKISLYSDLFNRYGVLTHIPESVHGSEIGLRWQWKVKQKIFRVQWRHERKSIEDNIGFSSTLIPAYVEKHVVKFAYLWNPFDYWLTKVQTYYTNYHEDPLTDQGFGVDLRLSYMPSRMRIDLDWVSAWVNDYNARLYFWDINLPGEMRSRLYSKDSHSIGVKTMLKADNRSTLAFRFRRVWVNLPFSGIFDNEGALILQVSF